MVFLSQMEREVSFRRFKEATGAAGAVATSGVKAVFICSLAGFSSEGVSGVLCNAHCLKIMFNIRVKPIQGVKMLQFDLGLILACGKRVMPFYFFRDSRLENCNLDSVPWPGWLFRDRFNRCARRRHDKCLQRWAAETRKKPLRLARAKAEFW